MKRILLFILFFLPMLASAYDAEVDGIYYSLFPEKNVAKVTFSPSGYSGSVDIPEKFTYEGVEYSVTSIGALAFNSFGEYSNLTSVTIPNSVTRIEPEAFGGCSNLTSVTIPASVTDIAYGTFGECNGLTSVHITDLEAWCRISFGSRDANPLYYAHHLYLNGEEVKDLVIPNSVTSLGRSVFHGCSGLTSLTIPNSVTSIEMYAFAECSGLTSVSIPNSLTSLGTGIFWGCSSLASVTIPNSVTSIGAYAFRECSSLTSVTIPNSVTQIAQDAFHDCSGLTSVTIGSSVMRILGMAFANCSYLKELYCLAENVPVLLSSPFQNCHPENITLYVPAASVDAYSNAAQWKDFGNIVALPDQDVYRPFYYYRGNKIPLTRNENNVIVSVPKENKEVSERIQTNVQTLASIRDDAYDIYVITRTEYEKLTLLDFWAEDSKSIILSSSYFTESNKEVYASPYLNVRLKKEEDIDLLTSYAEQYKLTIVRNSPLMPLWYILAVTPESEKSPLDCANELYESGNFASSVPDLVDAIFPEMVYRPFVEEGKVWTIKVIANSWPTTEEWTEYYYLEGDTIVNGQMAKRMLCDRTGSSQDISGKYVGACYEQDKKVYYSFYNGGIQFDFERLYDFTLSTGDSITTHGTNLVVNKLSGGIPGFKGTYYDFGVKEERWLEGVGSESWPWNNHPRWANGNIGTLLSCRIGDEVIYYNSEVEDPCDLGAKKHRFDFTHTVKNQPKAPRKNKADETESSEIQSLYGEYNNLQLDINLDPLDEAYIVRITNESGKVVYEKAINAGSIVALSIDISNYAKGRYTVTMENSSETFTGEFETQETGIKGVNSNVTRTVQYYSIDGKRRTSIQRGLNIIKMSDGTTKKVVVK